MLADDIDNINYNNVIICDPIKNSVIQHSNFYKVIYSNKYISFNGLYILFKLEKNNSSKDYMSFDIEQNKEIIDKLHKLECYIFSLCNVDKHKTYKLKELLQNGYIKYNYNDIDLSPNTKNLSFMEPNSNLYTNFFILKISGLWETKENMGITFKIIKIKK